MRPITLQQIQELPDKERWQLGEYANGLCASYYKRMKQASLARREIEAGIETEPERRIECQP